MNRSPRSARFAKVMLLAVTSLGALLNQVTLADTQSLPDCVAEVLVTAQKFDSHFPWKKGRPESRAGYGIVMENGRLITTEDLVRNAMLIEIQHPGGAVKTTARVIEADPRINAALLEAATSGYTPAQWGAPVGTGAKVQIIQFDVAGQLQSGDGRITGI